MQSSVTKGRVGRELYLLFKKQINYILNKAVTKMVDMFNLSWALLFLKTGFFIRFEE